MLLLLLSSALTAQEPKKNEVRLFFQPEFVNESNIFNDYNLIRDFPEFKSEYGYEFGLRYKHIFYKNLSFSTGTSYFFLNTEQYDRFGKDYLNFKIIRIPFGISYDFANWLELNIGLSADFQLKSSDANYFTNQSGISAYFNPCFRIPLTDSYKFEISPILTHFRLTGFKNDIYSQQFLSYGIIIAVSKCF
jgi:hypothetical protein